MIPEETGVLTNKCSIEIISSKKYLDDCEKNINIKVYKRRWFMLILYMFYACIVSGQWIEYSIISNIIVRYYNVPLFAVHCTTIINMMSYVIFILPMTYLSDQVNLRSMIILGSLLCFFGSWIKIFSVAPNRFLVTLLGQFFIAVSMVISIPMPSQLAATWFGADELSTATSFSIFGMHLGGAIMFLLPPYIVKNHDNIDDIGTDLSLLFWIIGLLASLSFILILIFFENEPKLPPSKTRALQKNTLSEDRDGYVVVLKKLSTNISFLILNNSYGLNLGSFNALFTLLNSLYLLHFKDGEEDVGSIGVLFMLTALFGTILIGVILDKTHKFKETAVTVYFLTLCGQILFSIAIFMEIKWLVFTTSIFLGFFMSGYLTLGYELATEYTYPILEFQSAAILNTSSNIYGTVIVVLVGFVFDNYGDLYVHIIFCAILLFGLILTIITKDEQRRQDARKAAKYLIGTQQEAVVMMTTTTTTSGS